MSDVLKKTFLNGHEVSTVQWSSGLYLPYETMIFCNLHSEDHGPKYCDWNFEAWRYTTEENALRGHAIACNNMTGEKHDDEQEGL